jgi:hypothetical protein
MDEDIYSGFGDKGGQHTRFDNFRLAEMISIEIIALHKGSSATGKEAFKIREF